MNFNYTATERFGERKTDLGITIPNIVHRSIQDGKAILNATLGKGGVTVWVQFLDPDSIHITYTVEQATSKLEAEILSPPTSPARRKGKEPEQQKSKSPTSMSERFQAERSMTIEEADERIRSKKLDRHRHKGIMNFYPTDSLVDQDFRRVNVKDFLARATAVAHRLGVANCISRIETNEDLQIPGSETIHEWWEAADDVRRVRLLTRSKKFRGECSLDLINKIACPFRDADLGKDSNQASDSYESHNWSD